MNNERPDSPDAQSLAKSEDEVPDQPLRLLIDDFRLRDGVVHFRDDVPSGGFATTAHEINIDLQKFALDTDAASPFKLS